MESARTGHRLQLATLIYFVLASLILGTLVDTMNLELGIISGILVAQFLMIGLVIAGYMVITKSNLKETFRLNPISGIDVLICIGIGWTIMPLLSFINVLSQFFVTNQVTEALGETLSYPFLVTIALTAVTPAVLEELLTRSIILKNYEKHSVLVVCLMSGTFFGFIHLNINQFLYAFVMGIIMCYVVMVTNSIYSSMIIHFIINATGISMLYIANALLNLFEESGLLMEDLMSQAGAVTTTELLISLFFAFFMALFFTPISGILINTLMRRHGKTFKCSLQLSAAAFIGKEDAPEVKKEKIITPVYIATMIIFLVFAIMSEVMMQA